MTQPTHTCKLCEYKTQGKDEAALHLREQHEQHTDHSQYAFFDSASTDLIIIPGHVWCPAGLLVHCVHHIQQPSALPSAIHRDGDDDSWVHDGCGQPHGSSIPG